MPLVQLLLVLVPQNALLLLEIAGRVAFEIIASCYSVRACRHIVDSSTQRQHRSYLHDSSEAWHQWILPATDLPEVHCNKQQMSHRFGVVVIIEFGR